MKIVSDLYFFLFPLPSLLPQVSKFLLLQSFPQRKKIWARENRMKIHCWTFSIRENKKREKSILQRTRNNVTKKFWVLCRLCSFKYALEASLNFAPQTFAISYQIDLSYHSTFSLYTSDTLIWKVFPPFSFLILFSAVNSRAHKCLRSLLRGARFRAKITFQFFFSHLQCLGEMKENGREILQQMKNEIKWVLNKTKTYENKMKFFSSFSMEKILVMKYLRLVNHKKKTQVKALERKNVNKFNVSCYFFIFCEDT